MKASSSHISYCVTLKQNWSFLRSYYSSSSAMQSQSTSHYKTPQNGKPTLPHQVFAQARAFWKTGSIVIAYKAHQ
jgi:hypothetical protein